MKIAELNKSHFSDETLTKLFNKGFNGLGCISWFDGGFIIRVEEGHKNSMSDPYDLVTVVSWIKKNKYEYALVTKDAPIVNSIIPLGTEYEEPKNNIGYEASPRNDV